MADVRVRFRWQTTGAVALEDGRPRFPAAPDNPGIWRVTIGQAAEHGASQDLRAAIYQLAGPGPTQSTYRRVHAKTVEGLEARKPVRLDVITSAEGNTGGRWFPLDLRSEDVRALVRAAAVVDAANTDPDPESAPYRAALATARQEVCALAQCQLMGSPPVGKPGKPDNADVKRMRQAASALAGLVAEHDKYWSDRWGHEGNPAQ